MKEKELEKHKIAAQKIEEIKNRVFKLIKRKFGKISEYDIYKFVLTEYK